MKRKSQQPQFTPHPTPEPDPDVAWLRDTTPPPLWNPSAAVNWSLLFTPVFGAILHMKNWQALGEMEKAETCKAWAILSFAIILGLSVLAALQPTDSVFHSHLIRDLGLVLIIVWYMGNAREQTGYIKSRFGRDYQRKNWLVPALLALLSLAVYIILIYLASVFIVHG